MKKISTIFAAILLTVSIWAQSPQKMSYQAVIRDTGNTLVTNTSVGMQISILQTTSTGTAVYVETQTPTTNANGLVSIEIGAGTVVSGTFSTIDWSAGPYFIKTETDPAGGTNYTITGTSELLSVPYALSAGNVTGLEKINEGANTGWRLVGRVPANYGTIGFNATDLSSNFSASTTKGAMGSYSTAMGYQTTASGTYATAMGSGTIASGYYATAMGSGTTASGDYATTMGLGTIANMNATAIGKYNIGGGNATTWTNTDPLFEIGNGTSTTPSNALTVFGGTDASLTNNSGIMMIGNDTGPNIVFDTNEIMARNNGTISPLYLQNDGGNLIINNANNGNVGIGTSMPSSKLDVSGVIRAQNNVWPTTGVGVEIAWDPVFPSSFNIFTQTYQYGAGYIQSYRRDLSEFRPLFLGGTNVLPVNDNSIGLGNSNYRWLHVFAVNGTIQTSDRRMKKEINNLNYGLNTVLKLRPVSYKWKKGNQNVNLGLIAQEVQKLIPEVIDVGTDKDRTLGMKYTELIPVLINAIQEQQKEITDLKKMVNKLLQKKYW